MEIRRLIQELTSDSRCILYEVVPTRSFDLLAPEKILSSPIYQHFSAFIVTDSPLANLKASSVLSSIKVKNILNKPVICTLSTRDKNSLALQSEIMALNSFDVRIFLFLTGDPIKYGNQKQAKIVSEGNSSLLLKIASNFNLTPPQDLNGNKIYGKRREIYPLAAINTHAKNPNSMIGRMRLKISRGAIALVSQPVYDLKTASLMLEYLEMVNLELGTNASLIFGFFPISSLQSAIFVDHLPGAFIPQSWLKALEQAKDEGREYEESLRLSKNLYKELMILHPKIHFMTSNKLNLAEDIILS